MQEPEKEGPSGLLVDLVRGGDNRVTILICAAAIALSIAGWTQPGLEPFVIDEHAFSSEPWRLVSAHFVHANFIHLYFNLTWIWFLGREIERRLGPLLLLAATLFMILGTSAAVQAFDRGAIGLSAVVYGMWAMLFVGQRRCELLRGVLTKKLNWLMVVWFLFCVVATLTDLLPISNWGHGAGAVLGAAIGLGLRADGRVRPGAIPIGALLLALLAGGATVWWPQWNFGGAALECEREGLAALQRSDWKAAESAYRTAVRLDPNEGPSWWNLGCALERLERYEESVEACYRSFECGSLDSKRLEVLQSGLRAQREQCAKDGNPRLAFDSAQRLVRVAPDDRDAWRDLERRANELGDKEWSARAHATLAKLEEKR